MGDFISGVLGTDSSYEPSQYSTGNPFRREYLENVTGKQNEIFGNQQWLRDQIQAQMAGNAPNPAQIQYMANVQNNIANAQGLMAAQRGLNPALATKMGSNLASDANAKAAQNAALLQANQQLGAQQQLGNLLGTMANTNVQHAQNFIGANTGAMQTNAATANANQQAAQGIVGGVMGGIGSAGGLLKAHGGEIEPMAMNDGGFVPSVETVDYVPNDNSQAPQSYAGRLFKSLSETGSSGPGVNPGTSPVLTAGFGPLGPLAANPELQKGVQAYIGGKKPAFGGSGGGSGMLAGGVGDTIGPSAEASSMVPLLVNKGGFIPKNFIAGGAVPGKAKVKGDHIVNDVVPAIVSPGEIVLPRSVTQSRDPVKKAADFVAAVLAKKRRLS